MGVPDVSSRAGRRVSSRAWRPASGGPPPRRPSRLLLCDRFLGRFLLGRFLGRLGRPRRVRPPARREPRRARARCALLPAGRGRSGRRRHREVAEAVAALDRLVLDHLGAVRTLLHGDSPRRRSAPATRTWPREPWGGAGGNGAPGASIACRPRWGIAVLVSGNGTNLQALLDDPFCGPRVSFVLSDRPGVRALERAEAHGVEIRGDRAVGVPRSRCVRSGRGRRPPGARHRPRRDGRVHAAAGQAGARRVRRPVAQHPPALLPSFPGMHGCATRSLIA